MRLGVRIGQVGAEGDPARVGVLRDRDAWRGEVIGGPSRGIGVDVVVVRHLLAVQLLGARYPAPLASVAARQVQGGPLVRVLPVPEHLAAGPEPADHVRQAGVPRGLVRCVGRREPGGDRGVIGGRVGIGPRRQAAALLQREAAVSHGLGHLRVHGRVGDDGDRGMVLRRRADHRRSPDVDLLDAVRRLRSAGHGPLERVEVGHEQAERRDLERVELSTVPALGGIGEQPRVHLRVQRLDPAVQAFGEAGDLLDPGHRQAGRRDHRRRAAGGDDLDTGPVQHPGEIFQAGFVIDADQRPGDGHLGHGPILTFRPWTDHPSRTSRPTVSTSKPRSATLIRSCRAAWSSSS